MRAVVTCTCLAWVFSSVACCTQASAYARLSVQATLARAVFCFFGPMDGDAGPRFAFGHLEHEDGPEEDVCADIILTEQTMPALTLRLANARGGQPSGVARGAVGDRR